MGLVIVHRAGLIPPSFGPAKSWCGMLVPVESTGAVDHPRGTWRECRRCKAVAARKRRLGIWPWGRYPRKKKVKW